MSGILGPGGGAAITLLPVQAVTIDPGAATGGTITLPALANAFHYITRLRICRSSTAALAGTATLQVTTTNLPAGLVFRVGNAIIAGGTLVDMDGGFGNPLKSLVVGTATTIVFPSAGAAVLWTATCWFYFGP